MNKIVYVIIAGALAFMASGCSNDDSFTEETKPQGGKPFTLFSLAPAELRISIGEKTENTYPVLWSDGDALGLFSATQGATIQNVQALLSGESIGQNNGIFTAEELNLSETSDTDLTIYYPYKQGTSLSDDGNTIVSEVSTEQIQASPNNSEHIGKYSFAYAKATVLSGEVQTSFTLKHSMAYVKFVISSEEFASYKLKAVSLFDRKDKTPLSGSFSVDMSNNSLLTENGNKPYATVTIANPVNLSSVQEAYLTSFPADLSGKEVYIVVTLEDDKKTTVTIPILQAGKSLKANAVNVINISNLKLSDNSCDWYEPVETRLLVGGWAYGESNCIMTNASATGVDNTISVKARGNFMEVEEPKMAETIFNCDLNNDHKMVGVNGLTSGKSAVTSDYKITVNTYTVTGGYAGGCGQVAIYGEKTDVPLWSFVVWMTPPPAEHRYGNTGYIVQDRNLGTYTIEDNWKTNGVYFQWGRPTPFGWGAKGYYSKPTAATNVRFSVENPRHLLYTKSVDNTKSDWYLGAWTGARTDRKDDFWGNPNESNSYLNPSDGHKSIYDPCPKGFRVVSPGVLDEIEKNGVVEKLSSIAVIKYKYDGTNYAFWPLAGCRWGSNEADRSSNNSTTSACYWSNSPASNYGNDKDQGGGGLYYTHSSSTWTHSAGRSHAFSIRCMKDTENR